MKPHRLLLLVVALPLLAGCGTGMRTLSGGESQADQDLREIKQRLVEIQRQATMTRVQVEEMQRRLEALERAAGIRPPERRTPSQPVSGSSARPPATRPAPTPGSPADRAAGRSPVEVVEESPVRPVPDAAGDFEESDLPPEEPPPARPSPPLDRTSGTGSGAADVLDAEPEPITAAAQALYDRGYTLYHQGRYLDAEASFQRFLQAYADTDLADNAQYWIGEARYARGDVPGSLSAFREVVARYPRGNKVPDALLKAGQALEQMGDTESARESYQQILESFPNSAATVAARERLAGLP